MIHEAAKRLRATYGFADFFRTVGVGIGIDGEPAICLYVRRDRTLPPALSGTEYMGFPLEVTTIDSPEDRGPGEDGPAQGRET